MRYLVNAFSLNMLQLPNVGGEARFVLEIRGLGREEFCTEARGSVNAVGHQGTADLVNSICGTGLKAERREIKVDTGDELILIQILTRLPEGKTLTREEIEQLLRENKVAFYKVKIG